VIKFSTVIINPANLFAANITYEIQGIRGKAFEMSLSVLKINSILDSRQYVYCLLT